MTEYKKIYDIDGNLIGSRPIGSFKIEHADWFKRKHPCSNAVHNNGDGQEPCPECNNYGHD